MKGLLEDGKSYGKPRGDVEAPQNYSSRKSIQSPGLEERVGLLNLTRAEL